MNRNKHVNKGFTLLEALISVTIFAIVMTIAVGALVTIVDSNRKSQSMQLAVNNVNAAVDHMSWQIRGGSDYYCINAGGVAVPAVECTTADQQPGIGFTGRDGSTYTYRLVDGRIQRTVDDGGGLAEIADITSSSNLVTINKLSFSLFGDELSGTQPAVTIVVQGEAGVESDTRSDFNIQTSVSERFNLVYDADSNPSAFLECPFAEEPGRTIIDIVNIKGTSYTVRSDSAYTNGRRSVSGPEDIPEELRLQPGNYRVSAATFDEGNDTQPGEIAYFGLLNEVENLKSGHEGEMFVYTGRTDDIPHFPEWGDCSYSIDPNCWRSWYGVINDSLYIAEEAHGIKIFHGKPVWQVFTYDESVYNPPSWPYRFVNNEAAGRDRAVNYFKHTDENPASPIGDYVISGFTAESSCDGVSTNDWDGCANSFVPLCLAFDNLDITTEFEIEDF